MGSSSRMRTDGVYSSSYCPFRTAQKKATKKPTASRRLVAIRKKMIFMREVFGFRGSAVRCFFTQKGPASQPFAKNLIEIGCKVGGGKKLPSEVSHRLK